MNSSQFYLKYRMIIWPAVVGISSIIILALVIIPQLLTYMSVRDQINQTQNKSQNLEAKASELENVDSALTQKDLKVAFSVLPTDQDVPRAMMILQDMVAGSGLELKSTTFGSSGSKQTTAKNNFQLNVTVTGQISALRDFFVKLQNSPRLFQVESIGVQFQKNQGVIEAEIPLSVFYQTGVGQMGPVNQPLPKMSDKDKELLAKFTQITNQAELSLKNEEATSASVPLGKSDPFQ